MAIFNPGPAVGQISGRIGGSIFSHNRGGAYIRNGAIPTKSTTTPATQAKARLAAASMAWQGLTSDQRLGWGAFSVQNPTINRLGSKITLSGHQQYVRNFCRCDRAGVATLADPPVGEAPATLTALTLSLDIGAGAFTAIYTATPLGATEYLWMYAAVVQSPGVTYVQNLLKLITVSAAAQASPYDFETDLSDRFGTLQVGHAVAVDAYVFDSATGLLSAPRRATGLITTT